MNMSTKMWLIWYYIKLFWYIMILETKQWCCQIVIKHWKWKWRQNMPKMMPNIMHNFYLAILNKNRIKWNTKSWFSMKVILIFTHWVFINAGSLQGIYDKKSKFDNTVCMLHVVIFLEVKLYHMNPTKYYIPIDLKTHYTQIWTKFTNIPIWHYFLFDICFKLRLEWNCSYDAT